MKKYIHICPGCGKAGGWTNKLGDKWTGKDEIYHIHCGKLWTWDELSNFELLEVEG